MSKRICAEKSSCEVKRKKANSPHAQHAEEYVYAFVKDEPLDPLLLDTAHSSQELIRMIDVDGSAPPAHADDHFVYAIVKSEPLEEVAAGDATGARKCSSSTVLAANQQDVSKSSVISPPPVQPDDPFVFVFVKEEPSAASEEIVAGTSKHPAPGAARSDSPEIICCRGRTGSAKSARVPRREGLCLDDVTAKIREERYHRAMLNFVPIDPSTQKPEDDPEQLELAVCGQSRLTAKQLYNLRKTLIHCRSIRIGSYRAVPADDTTIEVSGGGFYMKLKEDFSFIHQNFLRVRAMKQKPGVWVHIPFTGIKRIMYSFWPFQVIFLRLRPQQAAVVRSRLSLSTDVLDVSSKAAYRKYVVIVLSSLLPSREECLVTLFRAFEVRHRIEAHVGSLTQLTEADASELLLKTAPPDWLNNDEAPSDEEPDVIEMPLSPEQKEGSKKFVCPGARPVGSGPKPGFSGAQPSFSGATRVDLRPQPDRLGFPGAKPGRKWAKPVAPAAAKRAAAHEANKARKARRAERAKAIGQVVEAVKNREVTTDLEEAMLAPRFNGAQIVPMASNFGDASILVANQLELFD